MRECNPENPKADDPEYICNPSSGRWVLKNGAVGTRIRQRQRRGTTQRSRRNSQRQTTNSTRNCNPHNPKANDPRYYCNTRTGRWNLLRNVPDTSRTRPRVITFQLPPEVYYIPLQIPQSPPPSYSAATVIQNTNTQPQVSDYVTLSNCQDDSDYLNSQDPLTEFPIADIVSIKHGEVSHCFPRESILNALKMSKPVFASSTLRYQLAEIVRQPARTAGYFYEGSRHNVDINKFVDEQVFGTDNYPLYRDFFSYMRLYKWPLGPTMCIGKDGYDHLNNAKYHQYKLVRAGKIKDVSSFTSYGVGAIHGEAQLYNIVPIQGRNYPKPVV